jgi:hypothetical protein
MRFFWRLKNRLPDLLLEELTFGLPTKRARGTALSKSKAKSEPTQNKSRAPSNFDELKKAYSYVLGTAERVVVPEHQNYQVNLTRYFVKRGIAAEMEKDFLDVSFVVGKEKFIGEIKVTRNLTLSQAFRAVLGQLLDYSDMLTDPSQMVMFLDQALDERRLTLATSLHIAVVFTDGERFRLLNPSVTTPTLKALFEDQSVQ